MVILQWWLLELASEDKAELEFMDGPFAARLSGDRLTLTDSEKAVAEYSVDLSRYVPPSPKRPSAS